MSIRRNELSFFDVDGPADNEGYGVFAVVCKIVSIIAFFVGMLIAFANGHLLGGLLTAFIPATVTFLLIYPVFTNVTCNMTKAQQNVYLANKKYKKIMSKSDLPNISSELILAMEDSDASEVKNKLDNLHEVWKENQRISAVSDERILSLKHTLVEKTNYLKSHTQELKKMGELR